MATRPAAAPASGRPPVRDTPAPPPLPTAGSLAAAAQVCQDSLAQVVSLFDCAARNEPLPLHAAEQTVKHLLTALDADDGTLLAVVRLKAHGDYACMHSVAVCALMASLAEEMKMGTVQREQAALGGLLHDIGKAFVPSRILTKPGRLTEGEFAVVRGHPHHGFELLGDTHGVDEVVRDVAHHHHERPDGRGYPHGLSAQRIALLARMGSVCDVYDAITSNRPYKNGWDPAAAMQSLDRWAGEGQFDTRVLRSFRSMMGAYPIGSLVRLRSERLAVVNARAGRAGGHAAATAFYCLRRQCNIEPVVVPLKPATDGDEVAGLESTQQWGFRDLDRLWAGEVAQQMYAARTPALRAPRAFPPTA